MRFAKDADRDLSCHSSNGAASHPLRHFLEMAEEVCRQVVSFGKKR